MRKFPENFLWGAATSAHQVEGNNTQSDWWAWEQGGGGVAPSGNACDHYVRYEHDFDLAYQLHHSAHRLSLEWSRIQPSSDIFSAEALHHYRQVILALRKRNIEPIVTLHHFTNPLWFAERGGWERRDAHSFFVQYVKYVVDALGDIVHYWITINEPCVYAYHGYLTAEWPPEKKSLFAGLRVVRNLLNAHCAAYALIHRIYGEKGLAKPMVSIAKHMPFFESVDGKLRNRCATRLRHWLFNVYPVAKLVRRRMLDFIGVNYYTRQVVSARSWRVSHLLIDTGEKNEPGVKKSAIGWDIYPRGLRQILCGMKKYALPVFIVENGIATGDDALRWEFIRDHVAVVRDAVKSGIPVIGYLYWSLLDNFEWAKGFAPRFGLVSVEYATQQRTVRDSAKRFADICSGTRGTDEAVF